MAEIRPVSVQKVSAVLKKAGFQKTTDSVYETNPGFVVKRVNNGDVAVWFWKLHSSKVVPVKPEDYASALSNAGVECHLSANAVICTGINTLDPQKPHKEE